MNKSLILCLLVISAGCSSHKDKQSVVSQKPAEQGNWFCQMAESKDDWSCIQSQELANHPKPTRLPERLSKTSEKQNNLPPPSPLEKALDTQVASQHVTDSNNQIQKQRPDHSDKNMPANAQSPAPHTATSDLPAYQRLAFQPEKPMRLVDLPSDYYAVQIVALASKEALEAYVEKRKLVGLSAARIEKNGKLYYVLLLGIYQDRKTAELAAEDRPLPLKEIQPWIRRLGSLQSAMIKADKLAGSSEL